MLKYRRLQEQPPGQEKQELGQQRSAQGQVERRALMAAETASSDKTLIKWKDI